jgi:hypothetical protein
MSRLGLEHRAAAQDEAAHPPGDQGRDPQHDEIPVAEGHVDREAHPEGVDLVGRSQEQRPVDPVAPEQAARPPPRGVGHLELPHGSAIDAEDRGPR